MARDHRITLRLSQAEKGKITARAQLLGISESDVLRQMVNKQRLSQPTMSHAQAREIVLAIKELQATIQQRPDIQSGEVENTLSQIWGYLEKAVNRIT